MPNGTRATVFPHCVGAFSYYHKDYIQEVGYMDERFMNAWEHVEHTFKGCQMKLNPPFWYFVDHPASDKMLKEIPGSNHNSSIGVRPEHQENVKKGQQYWLHKWGMWLPQFPDKFYGW
jgi:hypothetical protein